MKIARKIAPVTPLIDKRVLNTRRKILRVAVQLYDKNGIENTSISQIIEAAQIGRTTFYRHFSDRDDLLNQALVHDFDAMLADFENARRSYDTIEEQVEEDMIWFLDQFAQRPALALLHSNIEWQQYKQTSQSIAAFRKASVACAQPTFERAAHEGRLRAGVTMANYLDWSSFVVVALQTVELPYQETRFGSREMVRNFLVPSLISDAPLKNCN